MILEALLVYIHTLKSTRKKINSSSQCGGVTTLKKLLKQLKRIDMKRITPREIDNMINQEGLNATHSQLMEKIKPQVISYIKDKGVFFEDRATDETGIAHEEGFMRLSFGDFKQYECYSKRHGDYNQVLKVLGANGQFRADNQGKLVYIGKESEYEADLFEFFEWHFMSTENPHYPIDISFAFNYFSQSKQNQFDYFSELEDYHNKVA